MGAAMSASGMENCYALYKYIHDEQLLTSNIRSMVAINIPAILPPAVPAFTVRDAMIVCGVNDDGLFDGGTPAERIATDLFGNDYACSMRTSRRANIRRKLNN
jgi:hypothetical protein